jgi:hypothetical protein
MPAMGSVCASVSKKYPQTDSDLGIKISIIPASLSILSDKKTDIPLSARLLRKQQVDNRKNGLFPEARSGILVRLPTFSFYKKGFSIVCPSKRSKKVGKRIDGPLFSGKKTDIRTFEHFFGVKKWPFRSLAEFFGRKRRTNDRKSDFPAQKTSQTIVGRLFRSEKSDKRRRLSIAKG